MFISKLLLFKTNQNNQLRHHLGSEPGLGVGQSQHPPILCTVGACEGNKPTDSKKQALHDMGQ